ncbi:MAG: multifunctional CCA tRNA nucleotidyl transferase/2'3'-cyclic phosphodiesterase/2'nucleotidase/phosphatase [Betaproteobacteria bacterium]
MKIYRVGGSVRDELLGLPVIDRDHVVEGGSPAAMIALGYRPVGRDFPVFLHPETHEEYALARTERKHGRGHQGFVFHADPSVTLAADLQRRDLTINAMARDEAGALIDPYGGQRDLGLRVLRHVSAAFAEDPLRVLRVARFAARFDFAVAEETEALMRDIVRRGELRELSGERVWKEFAQGLIAPLPSRMLAVLRRCGALHEVAAELDGLFGHPASGNQPDIGVATAVALDRGAHAATPPSLPVQFGVAVRHLTLSQLETLSGRLRASVECRDAGAIAIRQAATLDRSDGLSAADWLDLLSGIDALRRPDRLDVLLGIHRAWLDPADSQRHADLHATASGALRALSAIDYRALAGNEGDKIAQRVRQLRIAALTDWLERSSEP